MRIYPDSRSEPNVTTHLENTYWRLTDLADKPIHTAAHQREPYVVLSSASHRVKGSGGCNRLTGSYKVHGDELIFHQTTSTMMACLEGMQTEKAFLDALKQVNRWKITGQELEFLDTTGKVLASFEAHQLKSK